MQCTHAQSSLLVPYQPKMQLHILRQRAPDLMRDNQKFVLAMFPTSSWLVLQGIAWQVHGTHAASSGVENSAQDLSYQHRYRKAKNRLLKFCYVPTTRAAQNRLLFNFFFAAAVYSTTKANKASLKQSIILRCLCLPAKVIS